MNEFVDACRKEWKRLGVPDQVADEMAADLDLDLREAEADRLSAVEALGPTAFDPRSFAQDWAAEQGVIPPSASGGRRRRLRLAGLPIPFSVSGLALVAGALMATQRPTWRHFLGLPHLRFMGSVTGQGSYWAAPSTELIKIGTLLLLVGLIGLTATSGFWLRTHARRSAAG